MKRAILLGILGILASSILPSLTYYALELHGGSRILSLDRPVLKGSRTLFHRYPDGVYMSVAASEVVRVEALENAPAPPRQAERFAPGDTVYIGPLLSGPSRAPAESAPAPPASPDSFLGYPDYGYAGYPSPPPRPAPPVPPSRIGPNGFPILAPPGSPGSVPPPIGPNGYPILVPSPPRP